MTNTQRTQRARAAKKLDLVALPRAGYVTPETLEDVEREVKIADRAIAREIDRRQAARDKKGKGDE